MPIAYIELTVDTGCTTMFASDLKRHEVVGLLVF